MNALGAEILWLAMQISVLCGLAVVVYLIARRGSPSSGAAASLTGLLLVAFLSIIALSPWPRWSFGESDFMGRGQTSTGDTTGSTARASSGILESDTAKVARPSESGLFSAEFAEAFVSEFREQIQQPARQPVADGLTWSGWLAVVFLIGVAVGTARLLLGLASVRKLKASSAPISESSMQGLLDELCARFECTRPITLLESAEVTSAATVGWRRPLILLPADWPSWSEQERRSVLAHEIAHIRHNDFFCWLCAQAGLLLHFYHPLVHWLANRLRLEQELAADALAARHSGGPQPYLTTLAELALRQPDRPVAWPARTFLPTRGTLLRRIEMLRDTGTKRFAPSRWRRGFVVLTMLAAGLLLSGIRQPFDKEVAGQDTAREPKVSLIGQGQPSKARNQVALLAAQAETPKEPAKSYDLSLVPPTTNLLIAVRPYAIADDKSLKPLLPGINQMMAQTGLDLNNIEQFIIAGFPVEGSRTPMGDDPLIMITLRKDGDFSKIIERTSRQIVDAEHNGVKYQRSTSSGRRAAFYQRDGRTMVLGPESMVQYVMDYARAGGGQPLWAKRFSAASREHFAILVDLSVVRGQIKKELKGAPEGLASVFAPLWERTDMVIAGGSIGSDTHFNVTGFCDSEEGAKRVRDTAQSLIPLARNGLDGLKKQLANAPPQAVGPMTQMLAFGQNLLDEAEFVQDGRQVTLSIKSESGSVPILVGLMLPAVQSAREAARRTQSANNLKQILLALHNYHDVHKNFPPPVLTGPDGKTKYSWRVEILPYLEQQELYEQYNRNEPWNSPANLKVLQNMPGVYRSPNDHIDSRSASYFALVGGATGFGASGGEGNRIASFTDGTSNTMLVVEAKREIEWTRPDDIAIDFEKKLPKFGGLHPHGYNAGFADGSVRFIMKAMDDAVLKTLITRNGGEPVSEF